MTLSWLPGPGVAIPTAAEAYACAGWRVFPCTRDKRPLTVHGFADASADPEQVRFWWHRWPNAGIGWPVSAGLMVLDVDPRHGGNESLQVLEAEHGAVPGTLTARTGGGGLHLVFALPDGATVRQLAGFRRGLDTRAPGRGYVVIAPSPHLSGQRYAWTSTRAPALAPDWLVDIIRVPPPPRATTYVPPTAPMAVSRRSRYAAVVLAGEAKAVAETAEGGRNARLFRAWKRCAEFRDVIAREDAERQLTAAALAGGLLEQEIRKVLR